MDENQNDPVVLAEVPLEPTEQPEAPEGDDVITQVAKEVLAGHWGRGHNRERRLRAAGYNVIEINLKINELRNR